jgi:SPP1 family predicted phage head-tail adaptor
MARSYKPSVPFNVPMKILVPVTTQSYGVKKKTFSDPETSELIFGSFRTFGGTENVQDGVYTIIDTAVIDTWYRPDITADCQIYLCDSGQTYDIISDPEDVQFRHQYMQFKVRKVGGKP